MARNRKTFSLLPIDVGSDLRLHETQVELPKGKVVCVKYESQRLIGHPSIPKTICARRDVVVKVLRQHGYKVKAPRLTR